MNKYGELTKPTINMLPMKEIKEEILRSFKNENQIELEKMAVIYDGDMGNINSRDTVKNSRMLDGRGPSEYVLQSEIKDYDQQATLDVLQLKSELYELKNELIKNNTILHTSIYGGFQDPMKRGHTMYDKTKIESKRIVEQAPDNKSILLNTPVKDLDPKLNIGDYASLHLSNKDSVVDKVEDIEGKRMTMENKDFTRRNIRSVSSNTGEYQNGYYQFANTNIDAGSGDIKVLGFNDGRNKTTTSLKHNTIGLLHTFFVSAPLSSVNKGIESKSNWILRRTLINATPKTDEGHLTCYIIKADSYKDIEYINMQDLIAPENSSGIEIVAQSKPAYASQYDPAMEQEVIFDFTEKDSELDPDTAYGMLIVHSHSEVDTRYSTYWDITVSHYNDDNTELGDEHKSNSLFACEYNNDRLMIQEKQNLDLQYQVFLEEKTHVELMPHTSGLYTAYFDSNEKTSKALLSMRVKREGMAYYEHNGISLFVAGSNLSISSDSKSTLNIVNKGDKVIVGNNIREVSNVTVIDGVHNIVMTDDTYINKPLDSNKVPACRLGYRVFLTGYNKDNSKGATDVVGKIELLPTKVIQDDFDAANKGYSDRIIYESESDSENLFKNSNHFKLQIVWNSAINDNAELAKNTEFIGGIRDLNISLANMKSIQGAAIKF